MVLPLYFTSTEENIEFAKSEELDGIIKSLNGKLKGMTLVEICPHWMVYKLWLLYTDEGFRVFLKENKVTSPLAKK